jgi:hypothetical protein
MTLPAFSAAPDTTSRRSRPRRPSAAAAAAAAVPAAGAAVAGPSRSGPATETAAMLARAVAAAVRRLPDVGVVPDQRDAYVQRHRLETMLREAVEVHLRSSTATEALRAVPAVRVACAHLGAGDLEDAYLALLTARDLL